MAVRKLYTVGVNTFALGQVSESIVGFTVARSDEEVRAIVRRHVSPSRTFQVFMSGTGGPKKPDIARATVRVFLEYGLTWLDPRGPLVMSDERIPDAVVEMMTGGCAL